MKLPPFFGSKVSLEKIPAIQRCPKGRFNRPKGKLDLPKGRFNRAKGKLDLPRGRFNRPRGKLDLPKGKGTRHAAKA